VAFVFIRVFAWLAALPYALVAVIVLTGGTTWSAVGYVIAFGVVLAGLMTLPFPQQPFRRRRGLSRLGVAAVVVVGLTRASTIGHGTTMRVTDGEGAGPRWMTRLVDESDVSISAARALVGAGMLRDDGRELPVAMRAEYARMRREQGDMPSPVLATNLGLQSPSGFDVVMVEGADPARGAVVFLHGTAGNFDLPCWQVARAVASLGITTACPSTRWAADWESPAGEAIVRHTLALLRSRGVDRFVLVGLSAGGYGASLLAPRMKGTFAGLVLVSGADPAAAAPDVPTLVVQGRHDTMAEPEDGISYAKRTGARYVDVDAGHFALLVQSAAVEREIGAFVEARLGPTSP
jgi:predicted alpha/beta-hydrolase family hydrolase